MKRTAKVPKKVKILWFTECPVCGKTHTDIWAFLYDEKKKVYKSKCPEKKEEFIIPVYL